MYSRPRSSSLNLRLSPALRTSRLAYQRNAQVWYELRKTKGVGDTEYDKLVPWEGELVVVGAGGNGEALPPEAAPVCLPGPPARR